MGLSRDQICKAADARTLALDVPEWGGAVHVKLFTGEERGAIDTFSERAADKKDFGNYRAFVCAVALCDESGARLFDYRSPADLKLLGEKAAVVLERIFKAALAFNRVTAEAVEDATKN